MRDENGMKDDYRNYLFEHYLNVVNRYRPKVFVFENVPGIYTAKNGKIFEDIVFFGLIDLIEKDQEIKKKIVDVRKSYKVRDEKSKMIDELDIVITLKDGKLIVIECKTGSMTGDNAKSTNYTTYMLSGVYGMPLLIVPMIKGKIVLELKDKEDSYYYCVKSVKSAIRCNLEYYGIDKLKDILKTL